MGRNRGQSRTTPIEEDLRAHLASWIDAGANREWDRITLEITDDPEVYAQVRRFRVGFSEIVVGRGLLKSLQAISRRHWKTWKGSREARTWGESFVATLAARIVLYHELAHVMRGHLYELDRRSGGRSASFCWGEGSSEAPRGCARLARWMERDADIVGADLFAMFTALKTWRKRPKRDRRSFLRLCMLAATLTLLELERVTRMRARSRVHDLPFQRFLTYFEALGGALLRELRLEEEDLLGEMRPILESVVELAPVVKVDRALWGLRDPKRFSRVSELHSRMLDRYSQSEDRHLSRRSSFLPDVGPGRAGRRDRRRR